MDLKKKYLKYKLKYINLKNIQRGGGDGDDTNCRSKDKNVIPCEQKDVEERKKHYIKQALIFHPDKNTSCDAEATKKFQELEEKCPKKGEDLYVPDAESAFKPLPKCVRSKFIEKYFKPIPIEGDGNCFYRTLEEHFERYEPNSKTHDDIRKEIYEYAIKNPSVCGGDSISDKYRDNINKDGEWAGEYEICLAAKLYDKQIIVFMLDQILPTFFGDDGKDEIYIYNCSLTEGGDVNHYEYLLPIKFYLEVYKKKIDRLRHEHKNLYNPNTITEEKQIDEILGIIPDKSKETDKSMELGIIPDESKASEPKASESKVSDMMMFNENNKLEPPKEKFNNYKSLGGNHLPYYSFPLMTLEEFKKNKKYIQKIIQ